MKKDKILDTEGMESLLKFTNYLYSYVNKKHFKNNKTTQFYTWDVLPLGNDTGQPSDRKETIYLLLNDPTSFRLKIKF